MHPQLLDLETKLTILANNPCACAVCRNGARLAKHALIDASPSGMALLSMPKDAKGFAAAEKRFWGDEVARLQEAYDLIGRGQCQLAPPPALDTPPEIASITPIPELPDADAFRSRIEFYRKHAMKPRMTHRRGRITLKENPRVPGSYWIK
jgi:hypothetical protein